MSGIPDLCVCFWESLQASVRQVDRTLENVNGHRFTSSLDGVHSTDPFELRGGSNTNSILDNNGTLLGLFFLMMVSLFILHQTQQVRKRRTQQDRAELPPDCGAVRSPFDHNPPPPPPEVD